MRSALLFAAVCTAAACGSPSSPGAKPGGSKDLVEIGKAAERIVIDIRYATTDNFTGSAVYPAARCLLRRPVAARLARVQSDLAADGLGLKVWDCYRPLSAQRRLWELVRDPRYVADPKKGSRHNRGASVDVTLVDREGRELEMPSGYDDFSPRAHRDFRKASAAALRNRARLERAMSGRGFIGLRTEWWHFDAPDWSRYPLLDLPLNP